MKKTLKELLWFVIPIVMIVAIIIAVYAFADFQVTVPKWIGINEYFVLFLEDGAIAQSVLNTTLYSASPALLTAIVIFVVQLFAKMKRALYYEMMVSASTLATLCFKVFYLKPLFFGYPCTTYPADSIVAKPEEVTPTFADLIKGITLTDILLSLLVGILVCFVFWVIEQIVKVTKRRISK